MIDFLEALHEPVELKGADFVCSFHYPSMAEWAVPLAFSIRSDPTPPWTPHRGLQVPFHTARNDRLFVMTFWVAVAGHIRTLLLFARSSMILSHIHTLQGETQHHFSWEDWGPSNTRLMPAPQGHSSVWVCYVFGTKFVSPKRRLMRKEVQVYDFNLLPAKRWSAEKNDADDSATEEWVTKPTTLQRGRIFEDEVSTSLPYRVQFLRPRFEEGERDFDAVMLSEDTLITLTSVSSACVGICDTSPSDMR